ncbi:hypothetical protein [Bradyrhizobium sp. LeoA1S1]
MPQQGPILIASTTGRPAFARALDESRLFPVIETTWTDAARAVTQVQPAAVIAAASSRDEAGLAELAAMIAPRQPYRKPPRKGALRRADLMVENCTYGQPYNQCAEST